MDYSKFRFRAEVDWIGIQITTEQPTNFQTIRRKAGLHYVEAVDALPSGAATSFQFDLQDPQSWKDIDARLAVIEQSFPFALSPMVTGIEISFDAYSRSASRDELSAMAAHFFKFNTAIPSLNRRWEGRRKGDVAGLGTYEQIARFMGNGRVLFVGEDDDPITRRVYFKKTDQNGKVKLPDQQHRARIEVTLRGAAVPFPDLASWRGYRFTEQASYFKFRKLKDGLETPVLMGLEHINQVGERRVRRRQEGGTRLFAKSAPADATLNDRAYGALKELTRRMNQ